jgi:hypothetical protein
MPESIDLETFCSRHGFQYDASGVVDMTKALQAYQVYLLEFEVDGLAGEPEGTPK